MRQNDFCVQLIKTSKVDITDQAAPLPPHLGVIDEHLVSEYYCPEEWSKDGIFLRVEEGQPLWIDLRCNPFCACLPSIQRLNPVTGEPANLEGGLKKDPVQNYLVLPEQMWLDGYANNGKVYQFVVTKAGEGLAVNEYALPKHMQDSHALGFAFYAPKVPPAAPFNTPIVWGDSYYKLAKKSSICGQSMAQPMWFSPTHTPQNWTKGGLCSPASAPAEESIHYSADSIQITCSANKEEKTSSPLRGIMLHDCIADNYNEVLDNDEIEVGVTVETQDITEQHQTFDKASMGMGGRIDQRIVPDKNTTDFYHEKPDATLTIYLALPEQYDAIMKKGKRQDPKRKDKYTYSGKVGGVQIPLVK